MGVVFKFDCESKRIAEDRRRFQSRARAFERVPLTSDQLDLSSAFEDVHFNFYQIAPKLRPVFDLSLLATHLFDLTSTVT